MKIDELFSTYNVKPNVRFESDFGSVILSLIKKGLGISVIPYSYSMMDHAGVRFIKLPFKVPLYLHWRRDEENALVRNVLDLVV